MSGYHKLSNEEIEALRTKLVLPKNEFPYYLSPFIDGQNVNQYEEIDPLTNEYFEILSIMRRNGPCNLKISNYGRVQYNGRIIKPYLVGTFLNCTKVYDSAFGDHYVYNLVKEAFDQVPNRNQYQIHHIDNNALDNRMDNLIYVTEDEHRNIDNDFNQKLIAISREIHKNNYDKMLRFFIQNNGKSISGKDLQNHFNNTFIEVIKWNIEKLSKNNIVICAKKVNDIEDCIYYYNN